MSRPLRLEHAGAIWHVTSRGNEHRDIFRDDTDRERFLETLGRMVTMCRWIVHAYVLMGNHYHLLLETPEPNLAMGMRQINGIYSQAFNRRHKRVGHLFQGRYKAVLVQRESHLLELARYIVLNPVRAGAGRSAREWKWSNYQATAGLAASPSWLEVGWSLEQFGRSLNAARRRYRKFVSEGRAAGYEPWSEVVGQVVLGDENFRMKFAEEARRTNKAEIPQSNRRWAWPTVQQVAVATVNEFGVKLAEIPQRGQGHVRSAIALLARELGSHSFGEIGAILGVTAWSASHLATRAREIADSDRSFRHCIQRIRADILGKHRK